MIGIYSDQPHLHQKACQDTTCIQTSLKIDPILKGSGSTAKRHKHGIYRDKISKWH